MLHPGWSKAVPPRKPPPSSLSQLPPPFCSSQNLYKLRCLTALSLIGYLLKKKWVSPAQALLQLIMLIVFSLCQMPWGVHRCRTSSAMGRFIQFVTELFPSHQKRPSDRVRRQTETKVPWLPGSSPWFTLGSYFSPSEMAAGGSVMSWWGSHNWDGRPCLSKSSGKRQISGHWLSGVGFSLWDTCQRANDFLEVHWPSGKSDFPPSGTALLLQMRHSRWP